MGNTRTFVAAAAVALLTVLVPFQAEATNLRIGGTAQLSQNFGQTYFSVGGLLGAELALGLELEVRGTWWMGNRPNIFKLSPGLTWYAPLPIWRPYVGVFYARWFVGDADPDQDSIGARAGVHLVSVGPLGVGIGAAYERRLDCPADCDSWIPEAFATVSF